MVSKQEIKRIMEKVVELVELADKEALIFGNSSIEFGERNIKVINPEHIVLSSHNVECASKSGSAKK